MLEDKVSNDMKQAMKNRDAELVSTLRFLMAALKNLRIDKHLEKLEDADVITTIKKQIKQRQDSIEQYTKANRKDLADKENRELSILKKYLPAELSEDALKKIIQDVIAEIGATSMKEMGTVMKGIGEKTKGAADNKIVSQLVRTALGG
ncbi:MAG: GatB/YqeY domain-containing protein [Candidatus Omnitrophica bacterium]|nr:GatB/YqeY domain-containing protein [Candidatus Omnitrophota bacterium]